MQAGDNSDEGKKNCVILIEGAVIVILFSESQ
jgi:hypothetical protein